VLQVAIGVALLLVLALVGHRRTFMRLPLASGAQLVFLTGTEFILVGVALGPALMGVLDAPTVASLTPLLSLGLGAAGLIFGLQLELPKILRFPPRHLLVAGAQASVVFLAVAGPCYLLLRRLLGDASADSGLAAVVLGATAACTAQTALALLARELRIRGAPLLDLLRYISSVDAVVGLFALGIAFSLVHAGSTEGLDVVAGLSWFAVSAALGGALGLLLHGLTQVRCSQEELAVFLIGAVVFGAGAALYLGLSALFVNAVMGFVVANLPGTTDRIFQLLARLEKPFYLVFLILAGAVWQPAAGWELGLALSYVALRFLGKLAGGWLGSRLAPVGSRPPAALGLGLLSQGGIAIAMVMDYRLLAPGGAAQPVVTTVLAAVILNELASPSLARLLLRRAQVIPA
jgi:hypothetical protein